MHRDGQDNLQLFRLFKAERAYLKSAGWIPMDNRNWKTATWRAPKFPGFEHWDSIFPGDIVFQGRAVSVQKSFDSRPKELEWFVVINEEKTILAVYGGALLSEAQAKAKEIQDNTGCLTYLEKGYCELRPHVGDKFVSK